MKKILSVLSVLLLLCPFTSFGVDFSMRPIQLPILRKLESFLGRMQKKHWLSVADRAFKRAGLYALFSSLLQTEVKIIPAYKPIKSSNADKRAFKAVTANMLLYPKPFLFSQNERVKEFLKMLKQEDPDFVFLQEVWDKTAIETILSPLSSYYAAFINEVGYNFSGLLVLSKYPIKSAWAARYPISLGYNVSEIIAQKALLCASTEVNGREICLVATHLFSGSGAQRIYNKEQIKYLLGCLSCVKKPIIIGADMNNTPSSLDKSLPSCIKRDDCRQNTSGYPYPTQKLDYIMVWPKDGQKANIHGRRIDYRPRFSDHLSLSAVITFY